MPTLSLLSVSQAALVVALSAAVNLLVGFAKPLIEAVVPDTSAQHDAIIRLFVLLLSELVTFGYVLSQGLLTGGSAFGYALGGVIIAGGAMAAFHISGGVTSASAPSADPQAIVQAAINTFVPPAGVVPPASAAPAPAPAALVENAVTSNAAAEPAPAVASA